MSRQLATMVSAGLTLVRGARRARRPDRVQAASRGHAGRCSGCQQGSSLSSSLEKLPKIFPPLYIAMVRAGEVGGQLDLVPPQALGHT